MKDGDLDTIPPVAAAPELKLAPPSPLAVAAGTKLDMAPKLETWNTKNVGLRLCADAVSAASAAVLVAPLVSIIDRYVVYTRCFHAGPGLQID
jgi:hypothetical protein